MFCGRASGASGDQKNLYKTHIVTLCDVFVLLPDILSQVISRLNNIREKTYDNTTQA